MLSIYKLLLLDICGYLRMFNGLSLFSIGDIMRFKRGEIKNVSVVAREKRALQSTHDGETLAFAIPRLKVHIKQVS